MSEDSGGTVTATGSELVRDPDGVVVELVPGASTGLAYVAVTCADLERSVVFYAALGFHARTGDGPHVGEVILDAPGRGPVQLVLTGAGAGAGRADARPANARGIWRTALLLADLDAAVDRLRSAGIPLISEPQAKGMGPGLPELRFVCLRGPDREVIELIESPAAIR